MPPHGPPGHPSATPPGQPVLPYRDHEKDMPAHTLPHTTAEKAALCDALLPFLTGLREALWAITAKNPGAYPGGEAIYMGQLLLADVRRLVRGDPMAHYIRGLTLTDDLPDRFGLAVKIGTMETAATEFKKRYFGHHPSFNRPAWYLCGEYAIDEAGKLLPRDSTVPGEKLPPTREQTDLRDRLAARIEELSRADTYKADPMPLHAARGAETSKEVALRTWPRVR